MIKFGMLYLEPTERIINGVVEPFCADLSLHESNFIVLYSLLIE
jgi:hypothetical protein